METRLQSDWLAQTKLHPPQLHGDLLARPRLLAALRQAIAAYRVTLLSAPAGYGKTTLLAQVISDLRFQISDLSSRHTQAAICNLKFAIPAAWLSLDADDNDPTRFLSGLIAALQQLNPACGSIAQTLLAFSDAPTQPPGDPAAKIRRVLGVWINDLVAALPEPFALVLDDLHLVGEPLVYVALEYLIDHAPPQMRVAIATRRDPLLPLARWRARGELAELRLADLRFTAEEEAEWINDCLRLNLSPGDLETLRAKTEGWPVGLRLTAASIERLRAPAARAAFIAQFAGADQHILDFLAEEVLKHVPARLRTFLLQTAILPELTAPLCAAVTHFDDAAELLQEIYRRNLFVVAASETQDEGRRQKDASAPSSFIPHPSSFHYHVLFADFMRQRLAAEMPDQVVELHRRAAQAQTNPTRAIQHYLAAQEWDAAAEVIERVGREFLGQGWFATLDGWIRALPLAILDAHPRLALFAGQSAIQQGNTQTAQSELERAAKLAQARDDREELGEALAALAVVAFLRGDLMSSGALTLQASEYPLAPLPKSQMLMGRATLSLYTHDWEQAQADVASALALVMQSDQVEAWMVVALHLKPHFIVLPGMLDQIEYFCQQARPRFGNQASPLQMALAEAMTFVHVRRGRLDEATRTAQRALALKERLGGFPFVGTLSSTLLAAISVARGDYDAAERLFAPMLAQVEQAPMLRPARATVLHLIAWTAWLQGRLARVRDIYAQMGALEGSFEMPESPVLRLITRALIEMEERRYPTAERTLREAVELEKAIPPATAYASARLVLAHLYLQWHRPDDALVELGPLLAKCEREQILGYVLMRGAMVIPLLRLAIAHNVHAHCATRLLEALGVSIEPRPVRVPETGETLTAREVVILRHIAAGASNREIAQKLIIAEETVKTHVAHILRKLDVSSRTQAAACARALRIV